MTTPQTIFPIQRDIGEVSTAGRLTPLPDGSFTLTGSGANVWGNKDGMFFISQAHGGNGTLSARFAWQGASSEAHRKTGLMMRGSDAPDSAFVAAVLHGDGSVALQFRAENGGSVSQMTVAVNGTARMSLQREDDLFFIGIDDGHGGIKDGGGNVHVALPQTCHAGIFICAHNNAVTETVVIAEASLSVPTLAHVPDTGYPAAVTATLETMEVATGYRKVVHLFPSKMEAPNWTADNRLIYNMGGLIWAIPARGGEPEHINTGPLHKNNNDHGISPDGTMLIVSDQSEADNHSRIHVLPIEGSDHPRLVVGNDSGPSYWHAWTPDGGRIVYTAQRPQVSAAFNQYVYDFGTGEETRLTHGEGVDDGADFSHDGQWLYINSTRPGSIAAGAMKLWRMRPDGTEPMQITHNDDTRDWFPHPSPDGKWIAYIAFGMDIDLHDHPPNRIVDLRIMPADLSAPPRILASFHGGQGTINVPSWSPDSKEIAFVSYRLVR